jgi:hypothetical protein
LIFVLGTARAQSRGGNKTELWGIFQKKWPFPSVFPSFPFFFFSVKGQGLYNFFPLAAWPAPRPLLF